MYTIFLSLSLFNIDLVSPYHINLKHSKHFLIYLVGFGYMEVGMVLDISRPGDPTKVDSV